MTNLFPIPVFVGVVADWVRPAITPFHPTIDGLTVRSKDFYSYKLRTSVVVDKSRQIGN